MSSISSLVQDTTEGLIPPESDCSKLIYNRPNTKKNQKEYLGPRSQRSKGKIDCCKEDQANSSHHRNISRSTEVHQTGRATCVRDNGRARGWIRHVCSIGGRIGANDRNCDVEFRANVPKEGRESCIHN